uniref:Uncharacterized protein n=1 Tax=Trichuris muris TaxID=70415 RepID=A0A5S6QIG3_TRIMR
MVFECMKDTPYKEEENVGEQLSIDKPSKDGFQAIGLPSVRMTYKPPMWSDVPFKVSDDFMITVRSMPASCAKHGLVVAGARALSHSDLARFMPELGLLTTVYDAYEKVLADSLRYHVGAFYLTSHDQNMEPNALADVWFGRIGTYRRAPFSTTSVRTDSLSTTNKIDT